MNIMDLSYDLNVCILKYLIPGDTCDIDNFKEYFLVCKYWYNILNSKNIWNHYCDKLNIFSSKIKYSNLRNFFIEVFLKQLSSVDFNQYNEPFIHQLDFIINNTINKHLVIEYNYFCKIYIKYNSTLINYLGYDLLKNIPVTYFNKSKCINGICSFNCYNNNHFLLKYEFKNNIVRGLDNTNRAFLLIFYKNTVTNRIFYEFIYHKKKNKNKTFDYLSYSGVYNNTYIGMASDNLILNNNYRTISRPSFSYLLRLITNKPCGSMVYDSDSDFFIENFSEPVTIYF